MNENLNLVEILKDCPSGTKLYSLTLGEVKLYKIEDDEDYPIVIKTMTDLQFRLTQDGRYSNIFDGECILFPSKDQRDWSKFVPPCKFKDGDIVATSSGLHVFILKKEEIGGKGYCYIGYDLEYNEFFQTGLWYFSRLATEEEKQKFFDALKLNGYKWNAETKTLEKLIQPKFKVGDKIVNISRKYMGASGTHIISEITDGKYICTDCSYISISNQDSWKLVPDRFDPKTLKPFDKVLVRDTSLVRWRCTFYSHLRENNETMYKYVTAYNIHKYCIPYNDDTKHLVGTAEEAPEYYRYWED